MGKGEYRLRVSAVDFSEQPKESLVELLRSCPVKGFFTPMPRTETSDDLQPMSLE